MSDLQDVLRRMPDRHLRALYRIAKTNRGLRPFFGPAKSMILLRAELQSRDMLPPDERRKITRGVTRRGRGLK